MEEADGKGFVRGAAVCRSVPTGEFGDGERGKEREVRHVKRRKVEVVIQRYKVRKNVGREKESGDVWCDERRFIGSSLGDVVVRGRIIKRTQRLKGYIATHKAAFLD